MFYETVDPPLDRLSVDPAPDISLPPTYFCPSSLFPKHCCPTKEPGKSLIRKRRRALSEEGQTCALVTQTWVGVASHM